MRWIELGFKRLGFVLFNAVHPAWENLVATMQPEVKKSQEVPEFDTEERCSIAEIANDSGDELVSIARARVKPGVTTAWHKLIGITERYLIVAGIGRVEIGGLKPIDVCEGDVVRIPADVPQRITNTGKTDLIFYAVCSPRFQQSCYVNLDKRMGSEWVSVTYREIRQ